jgi:hypothetical protein
VVVEGTGPALGAMAAYIDLNPVRAGLVQGELFTVRDLQVDVFGYMGGKGLGDKPGLGVDDGYS